MDKRLEHHLFALLAAIDFPAREVESGYEPLATEVKFKRYYRVYDSDGSYESSDYFASDLGGDYYTLVGLAEDKWRSVDNRWGDAYDTYIGERGAPRAGGYVRLKVDVTVEGYLYPAGSKLEVIGKCPPDRYVSPFDYEIEGTDGGYFTEEELKRDDIRQKSLEEDLARAAEESGLIELVNRGYSGDKFLVVPSAQVWVVLGV